MYILNFVKIGQVDPEKMLIDDRRQSIAIGHLRDLDDL